ncbi:alpha/beta hydrolase [Ketobacter sp.]
MKLIPVELRQKLPDFSLQDERPFHPALQEYRRFYKIDFENQYTGVSAYMGKTHVAGFDIVLHTFIPMRAKATVFVVHGYYDHVGIYNHLIKALLKNQCAVVAFDLPGHGLSSGSRAAISSFRQYQPVFKKVLQLCGNQQLPSPWQVAAQSTGCAIVAEYLVQFEGQEERIPFEKAVFYAPLIRPVNWFWNSKLHTLVSPFSRFVKRKFGESSNDEAFLEFVRNQDPLQPRYLSAHWVGALKKWIPYLGRHAPVRFPLLIIQGKCDQTVDWEYNVPVLEKLFIGTQVQYMAKVRHHVVNELELYRRDVFARTISYFNRVPAAHQLAIR